MEVRIGVRQVTREVTFESLQSAEDIQAAVVKAVGDGSVLHLVDDKGRIVLVPAETLGYVEIGVPDKGRVGFGSP